MGILSPSGLVRVLIVDDHPIIREGLGSLLARQPNLAIAAAVPGGAEAIAFLERQEADVALVDLRMAGIPGIDLIRHIRSISPATRILVFSNFELDEEIYQAVEAGANGYLMKDMDSAAILEAIREVSSGNTCFPRRINQRLQERQRRGELSGREREILELVAKGFTNKEIAILLRLSQFTVRNHLNRLTTKLRVSDRTEAAFFAIQTGLIIVSE